MKRITSTQNSYIKLLISLKEKAKVRQREGLFLIEGKKELSLAFQGGYEIKKILFCPEICSENDINKIVSNVELIHITKEIFKKLAYRDNSGGLIGIAKSKDLDLSSLKLSDNPLVLVAEAIEKPGNIGALLRTADAADIDAVIIANPKGDLYNPNIIRSSIGCLFTTRIATGSNKEIISFLKENKLTIYCASLQNSSCYHISDYTASTAFVVGSEAFGLSKEWVEAADNHIVIPMQGKIDSMNVSVSAGILIFEAKRQRGF